jgi:hypothetical protein
MGQFDGGDGLPAGPDDARARHEFASPGHFAAGSPSGQASDQGPDHKRPMRSTEKRTELMISGKACCERERFIGTKAEGAKRAGGECGAG